MKMPISWSKIESTSTIATRRLVFAWATMCLGAKKLQLSNLHDALMKLSTMQTKGSLLCKLSNHSFAKATRLSRTKNLKPSQPWATDEETFKEI